MAILLVHINQKFMTAFIQVPDRGMFLTININSIQWIEPNSSDVGEYAEGTKIFLYPDKIIVTDLGPGKVCHLIEEAGAKIVKP